MASPTGAQYVFLETAYEDLLGRPADGSGLQTYASFLANGGSSQDARSLLAHSAEAQSDIEIIYRQVFGREADANGLAAYEDALAGGGSLGEVRSLLAHSPEAETDINRIYQEALGRNADNGGLATYKDALGGGASLQAVRATVAHSPEAQNNLSLIYQQVLGRDADSGGLATYEDAITGSWDLGAVRSDLAHSAEAQSDLTALFQTVLSRDPSVAEVAGGATLLAKGVSLQDLAGLLRTNLNLANLPVGFGSSDLDISLRAIGQTIPGAGHGLASSPINWPGDDTVGGGITTIIGAAGHRIDFGDVTATVLVNTLAGADTVALGSGNVTVLGAGTDLIAAGVSGASLIQASRGSMSVVLGLTGSDTVFAGAGDTIIGSVGSTANATVIGANSDTINLTGWNGKAVIDVTQGNQAVTLGGGAATVFGGSGDTIATGAGTSTIVGGASGGMAIQLGASGTVSITDTHGTGAGISADTITASTGSATATIRLASGDSVDLSRNSGDNLINALAGNDTIALGSGHATVFAAQGDSVTGGSGSLTTGFGSGAVNVSLPGTHSPANIGDVGLQGTDTVTGFTQGQDLIFFQGAHANGLTPTQNLVSATSTTVGGTPSTILTFPDGTKMTPVSFNPSQIDNTFFK
jgi:Ca2+-binding RTX toxin-like protein